MGTKTFSDDACIGLTKIVVVLILCRRVSFELYHYRHRSQELLVAQVLSVVAFILSLAGWWLAWIAGLIAMIALMIACCAQYPRVVWIIISLLAITAAVGELLVLIGVVGQHMSYCGGGRCGTPAVIVIGVLALLSWLGVGVISLRQGDGSGSTCRSLPR